jgi:hypothetical protein
MILAPRPQRIERAFVSSDSERAQTQDKCHVHDSGKLLCGISSHELEIGPAVKAPIAIPQT